MKIIRNSPNTTAFLKELGIDAVVESHEQVSIGFRQEKTVDAAGNETYENVEVFGNGQASYAFEWPDELGAPPSEQDLDGWAKPVPVIVEPPTIRERVAGLTKAFADLAAEFLLKSDDDSPAAFLRFVAKSK